VFTYPEDIGWDWFNLLSTIGAFIFAAGVLTVVADIFRPKEKLDTLNPWSAGTLEWTNNPDENWGMRSVPIITSRYPLWDQPNLQRDIEEGRYYLPDAKSGRRETLVTSVLDAKPIQCLRVGGTSYVTIVAAMALGGVFIALTFHWWLITAVCGVITLGAILYWLWTGTAEIPEAPDMDVGLGERLPIYVSGPPSVGWWAMFITMVGDGTAFASLVFGYFFYWTIHGDFTNGIEGPGILWPTIAIGLFVISWVLMLGARRLNRAGRLEEARVALVAATFVTLGGSVAGLLGPYVHGMDPTAHVYPAIVWILAIWAVVHAAVGCIMQLYCLARSLAGKMTERYDQDIINVTLYWHFLTITAVVAFGVIGLFPVVR
jgi:cytochrome c oxidase subunit I+III